MSDSDARLRILVDATQAVAAKKGLDDMTRSAQAAEKSVAGLAGASRASSGTLAQATTAVTGGAKAMETSLANAAKAGVGSFLRMEAASIASRAAMAATFSSVIASAGTFAATFVPGGILVAGLTYGLHKIVDLFVTTRDELKKTQEEFAERMDKMRLSADGEGLMRQARSAQSQIGQLQGRLTTLTSPDNQTVAQLYNNRGAARAVRDSIATLQAQIDTVKRNMLEIPSQVAPSSGIFPGLVTVETAAAKAREDQRLRDKAKRDSEQAQDEADRRAKAAARAAERARQRAEDREEARIAAQFEETLGRDTFARDRAARREQRLTTKIGDIGESVGKDFLGNDRGAKGMAGAQAAASQAQAIFQSFSDGMQRTLSGAFAGLFTKGLRSAADFAVGLRDLLINAISEVAASKAMAALFGGGAGNAGGGLLASLSGVGAAGAASKFGGIAKGGAASGGFSFGAASLAGLGGLGIGTALGQAGGTGLGVAGGAAAGAALGTIVPGIGNVAGAIIGGLAGAIGGLFGGAARKKAKEAEQQAVAAARAQYEADKKAEVDQSAGVYLAPAGFSVNGYRFSAGRPSATVFTGDVYVQVPEGTTADQARALLDQFGALQRAQGLPTSSLPR
jgi:hypothetical protein